MATRFNPLFQDKTKKNIEVIQPKVINTSVHQTADNILIDKLLDDKLLVGKNDKISSSQYTISDLFKEWRKYLPTPLEPGTTGIPASATAFLAAILSPIRRI